MSVNIYIAGDKLHDVAAAAATIMSDTRGLIIDEGRVRRTDNYYTINMQADVYDATPDGLQRLAQAQ